MSQSRSHRQPIPDADVLIDKCLEIYRQQKKAAALAEAKKVVHRSCSNELEGSISPKSGEEERKEKEGEGVAIQTTVSPLASPPMGRIETTTSHHRPPITLSLSPEPSPDPPPQSSSSSVWRPPGVAPALYASKKVPVKRTSSSIENELLINSRTPSPKEKLQQSSPQLHHNTDARMNTNEPQDSEPQRNQASSSSSAEQQKKNLTIKKLEHQQQESIAIIASLKNKLQDAHLQIGFLSEELEIEKEHSVILERQLRTELYQDQKYRTEMNEKVKKMEALYTEQQDRFQRWVVARDRTTTAGGKHRNGQMMMGTFSNNYPSLPQQEMSDENTISGGENHHSKNRFQKEGKSASSAFVPNDQQDQSKRKISTASLFEEAPRGSSSGGELLMALAYQRDGETPPPTTTLLSNHQQLTTTVVIDSSEI